MSIEWKEGAVCYAFNHQWCLGDKIGDGNGGVRSVDFDMLASMIGKTDFQLNTIKQGDYIPKSELDTEDKYNRAVEVFGLFGYKVPDLEFYSDLNEITNQLAIWDGEVVVSYNNKRKLAFNQLMAIGELKRLMNERDNSEVKFGKNEDGSMKIESGSKFDVWPKVGVEAIIESPHHCAGLSKIKYISDKFVVFKRGSDEHSELTKNCTFKHPDDLIIEELQAKLIENNAVDTLMLAADIVNGNIEGLSYKSSEVGK